MSLKFRLAYQNLVYDRLRFVATIIGIVFSVVLVTIQMGLYVGFGRMVTTVIDHAPVDLWIMPLGTKCFEDPSLLDERERYRALSIDGVAEAVPVVVGYAQWRRPSGGTIPVFIVGSEMRVSGIHPWHLVAGNVRNLAIPGSVAVDQTYFGRLGVAGHGATAEIRDQKVRIMATTKGIRSFTTRPFVFTGLNRARAFTGIPSNKISYLLVRVSANSDVDSVRSRLQRNLSDVEILTSREFGARSRGFWLFDTGAGAGLFAGALLGSIVGTIIVAQTLYSSTKDRLKEFATLRAMGSSSIYICTVIIWQALLSAFIGFCGAGAISAIIVKMTANSALPVVMTAKLTLAIFLLTVAMCVVSAFSAIVQAIRLDPMVVFRR